MANNKLDFLRFDKDGNKGEPFFPKTLARGVYLTEDTSTGKTLDSFVSNHKHTIADISDLNISDDGGLILQPLTVLFNGTKLFDYNGIESKSFNFSLDSLGAAAVAHNHNTLYSKLNHTHANYSPLVHKHSMSDITDFSGGSGIGEVNPLKIQFNGFEQLSFDGKTTQTINITPSAIGAAESQHTHTFDAITNVELPKFTITLLGLKNDPASGELIDDVKVYDYDGSTNINFEISANSIGASQRGHLHPIYALSDHNHDLLYSKLNHNHDLLYSKLTHDHDDRYCMATNIYDPTMDNDTFSLEQRGSCDTLGGLSTDKPYGYASISLAGGHTAGGRYSIAAVAGAVATERYSVAIGYGANSTVEGAIALGVGNDATVAGDRLVLGGGTIAPGLDMNLLTQSTLFRVSTTGVYGGTYNTAGADYGEYWEWEDGNKSNADMVGFFVTTLGDKITLANSTDTYILGVVSRTASVIGNSYDNEWKNKFLLDEWGKILTDENMNRIENPDYDSTKQYIPRSQRPEWDVIGMFGVLLVRDDGTCQPNSYCKVADGGIATTSDKGFKVLARISDNVIKILFRGEDNIV